VALNETQLDNLSSKCRGLRLVNVLEYFNPLNPELNPICYLLALLAHHFLHVSRIRVKSLTIRLLMSHTYIYIYIYIYIYMEHLFLMFLDHTQRYLSVVSVVCCQVEVSATS